MKAQHTQKCSLCGQGEILHRKTFVLWSPPDVVGHLISTGLSCKMDAYLWPTRASSFHPQFMAQTLDQVAQLTMRSLKEILIVPLTIANRMIPHLENLPSDFLRKQE